MARSQDEWDPVCKPPAGLFRPVPVDAAGARGPTPGQARGPRWRRTSKGRYVPAAVDAALPEQRILEASLLLPVGGAVTGWAGLRLRGGNFFDGRERDGIALRPVMLNAGPSASRRPREGVTWSQDRMNRDEWSLVQGIRCARPERALFDEMRSASALRDAVVAADMAAAAELTSLSRMSLYVGAHPAWDGVRLVRAALSLASEHSRSPRETDFRMVWVIDAGLPSPLVNQEIFGRRSGRLLGIGDLLDVAAGTVGEFDGAVHAGARRRSSDARRDESFRNHKLETFRVTGFDLHDRNEVVARIHAARSRALWLPEPLRPWTIQPPPGWERARSLDEVLTERDMVRDAHERWEREGAPDLHQLVAQELWR